jgi:hypothetical protein
MRASHADTALPVEPAPVDHESDVRPPKSSHSIDRAFRWVTVLSIPVASFMVFRALYVPISDPDTFWHLRLGAHLLDTWRFSGPEPWSALASRRLVLHEWAPELVYILSYRLGGLPAVAWVQAVGAVALLLTLYVCCRRFAPALVAAIAAVAGFAGASGSVDARPQVVSFILAAVVTTAWMRTAKDGRARWWLVPLTWIWACSHGMWFVGVVIGLVVIVAMILDRAADVRSAARLMLIPLLSVVAAALTPVGPGLLLTARTMRGYTQFVAEWNAPSIFLPQSMVTLGLAAVVLVTWLRTPGRTPWVELAIWFTGVGFALMYNRTIALGAVMLALVAASVLARHARVSPERSPSRRLETRAIVLGTLAVLLLGPSVVSKDVAQAGDVPSGLDHALGALPAGTVVFNDYALGGWMLWAHPDLDPVIDGRADVYDLGYFSRTHDAYSVVPGWDDTVRESGAAAALLPTDSPLADAFRVDLGWQQVGSDAGYSLLVPASLDGS